MEVVRDARYGGGHNGLIKGDEKDRKTQRCDYREQLPALGSRWLLIRTAAVVLFVSTRRRLRSIHSNSGGLRDCSDNSF
jgi:hypothetical protein